MSGIYNEQSDNDYKRQNAPPGKQAGCIILLLALALLWAWLLNKCG